MNENIQQQILDELKNILNNLSVETVPEYREQKRLLGNTLINYLATNEENMRKVFERLSKIEELLKSK